MTVLQQLAAAQANAEVVINEIADTLSAAGIFGRRHPATAGLTWGYYGGYYASTLIADGTVALTASATNHIVVHRTTGVVSVATTTTNWDDTATYGRLYKVTTTASGLSTVTPPEDHRFGATGIFGSGGGAGGSTQGRHAVYIAAGSMRSSVAGGCASLVAVASAANQPDIVTLDFDTTTQEFAQFSVVMPKSWNEGTVTFRPVWSHAATTTNFGVVWELQGVAVSDDDAIAVAYGTAQSSTDTGGTTSDVYLGPESSAITIAGTPQAEDAVFFRIARAPANGSDTLAIDARLHGIVLYITTDADTDA